MTADPKAGPNVARARVPLVEKERATPAQLAVWDRIAQSRGRVAGPFAALLHSPELARRIAETGHYVRFEGPLSQAERELAIITVARVLDAQYEWAAHAVLARNAGVRDEVIAAIRERRAPAGFTPAEAQIFGYASSLLRDHRVSDEAFAGLQKRFGLEGLVDLTATIGYYAMIGCALNAFGIEPTPGEPPLPI
jgi:4-carboxymuconolactone decarboxylase